MMGDNERAPAGVDPTVPSVARMYDFYLGGKDNFRADREAAEQVLSVVPGVRDMARENRGFLVRAVRELAQRGVRQFLDIGAGLPTQQNVHQVALEAAPDSRIVYVDNDPIVLVHARALLADNDRTVVVEGDLLDPEGILRHPAVGAHLDFSQPMALLLVSVLHFVPGYDDALRIVRRLREALVPGGHLVLTHGYVGDSPVDVQSEVGGVYARTKSGSTPRTFDQIAAFFDGLDLLEPGLVPPEAWRPEWDDPDDPMVPDLVKAGLLAAVGEVR
jgi:SAM-dependent methyltransferase